jgi:hypothetical protein
LLTLATADRAASFPLGGQTGGGPEAAERETGKKFRGVSFGCERYELNVSATNGNGMATRPSSAGVALRASKPW